MLNVALDLRREIGEADSDLKKVQPNSMEAEKVNHIVVNNIYGGTVYMGGQHSTTTYNISIGNWQELTQALLAARINDNEITELSHAINGDGKTVGSGVKGWIARNAGKVWDNGLQVSATVGSTLLAGYIKQYLGLP